MEPQDHHKKTIKKGTLQKTGGEYALVLQSAADIDDILALQSKVYNSLSPEEQNFLLLKDRAFFEKHFVGGNLVLGVEHDGQLIAQSVILNPSAKSPKTGMVDMALDAAVEKVTVIQGVIVDPDFRGNRLMTVMVDEWLEIAKGEGRTNAIAEVTVDNFFSWSVFLKEGLTIHSIGTDPADGTKVYNLHADVDDLIRQRLKGTFNHAAKKELHDCAYADLECQRSMLAKGFQGVGFTQDNQTIQFRKKAAGCHP